VQVSAFFNFLQPKEEDEEARGAVAVQKSICLDCGYIAGACPHQHVRALCQATLSVRRGLEADLFSPPVDLNKEPFWYKCPVCGVGKNRFKPAEEAGANYSNLMAAKRAAKAAKAQAPKGQRPRDLLKQRQIEMGKEKGEKKGWF
jgi:Fe-S-cluster-containing dehydrogenase component